MPITRIRPRCNPKLARRQKISYARLIMIFLTITIAYNTILTDVVRTTSAVAAESSAGSHSSSTTNVASEFIKMHRIYSRESPHDKTLYDRLQVPSNATASTITKAYHKLSRQYHPDKQQQQHHTHHKDRHNNQQHKQPTDNDDNNFINLREAYDILKDDSTRLLYHRYGLIDSSAKAAMFLFSGKHQNHMLGNYNNMNQYYFRDLIRLMGYYHDEDMGFSHKTWNSNNKSSFQKQQQQRIYCIASDLIELIRPVIEGTMTENELANIISKKCDHLKHLPLGAQILRCIGRAYRYSGRKVLQRSKNNKSMENNRFVTTNSDTYNNFVYYQQWHEMQKKKKNKYPSFVSRATSSVQRILVDVPLQVASTYISPDFSENVEENVRHMKHIFNAAVASGRVLITEQHMVLMDRIKQQLQSFHQNSKKITTPIKMSHHHGFGPNIISYHWSERDDDDDDDKSNDDDVPTEEELKRKERLLLRQAILESLQVDALWKLSKIDLDRTIQQACDLILQGDVFFFHLPSMNNHQNNNNNNKRMDGWVSNTSGKAITADGSCRLRMASLLVMIGDILVQRSKTDTAWADKYQYQYQK